ncbi:MAG: DUF2120 family protein [Methanobrevibacter sp.]|uniref:DUF2120 domain-containing protein n=1 Tax=Methanobrevibacter millerae TaxID=230361 RepID=A0A8T3VKZ3_9EURY|nr:DUF2120 family protein [Methanobrevibacter sp.]MBE6510580.1 DUF2120 domain-containing protein [Methanobrevibacter millerae]MBO5151021.1 DUF2120 family protein [Methanobrevibacter sp.]
MQKKLEIAGQVMGFFDSFKGSRPAIDNDKILIVRSRSRKVIPIDELESKVAEIGEQIGGVEVPPNSKKVEDILKSGDQHIHETATGTGTIDSRGFIRVKEELESMGLVVAYKIFELPGFDVIIAIWEDKNELPPLYVEVTVSEKEE